MTVVFFEGMKIHHQDVQVKKTTMCMYMKNILSIKIDEKHVSTQSIVLGYKLYHLDQILSHF